MEQSCHVEAVVQLAQIHEAKHHMNVTLEMDELDIISSGIKIIIEKMKKFLEKEHGLQVRNLFIAQVKRKC